MPVDGVAMPPVKGRQDDRPAIDDVADMAERCRVQNGVDHGFIIVATLMHAAGTDEIGFWLCGHAKT